LQHYRTVVVRDSVRNSAALSYRLFSKKPALTVPSVAEKILAQKAGLGIGYLPRALIETELQKGELVALQVEGVSNESQLYVSWWRENKGYARQWFIDKLLANGSLVAGND
jgi:DNA-binding transcriptional LysR family regulator